MTTALPPDRASRPRRRHSRATNTLILLVPALSLCMIFILIPAGMAIVGSFFRIDCVAGWVWHNLCRTFGSRRAERINREPHHHLCAHRHNDLGGAALCGLWHPAHRVPVDEPLSNLDAALRSQMRIELSRLHAELGSTMIYVTHDQTEAMTMASRIVVLRDGVIEEVGTPLNLYNRPATRFVAGFLGSPRMNFVKALVAAVSGRNVTATVPGLDGSVSTTLLETATAPMVGDTVILGIRPEAFASGPGDGIALSGKVAVVESLGRDTLIYADIPACRTYDSESQDGYFGSIKAVKLMPDTAPPLPCASIPPKSTFSTPTITRSPCPNNRPSVKDIQMTIQKPLQSPYAQEIDTTAQAGPFAPNWPSLQAYQVPDWYVSGKFGIFIHWGVYSVPAFGNEWYARRMYLKDMPEYRHHFQTYGSRKDFGYKDFIPQFTCENYDPVAYAKLFKQAGATYVVPVAEHHDGFAMYDCTMSDWTSVKMGPKRDLVGELADAVRAEGMELGVSTHRAENYWFFEGGRFIDSDVRDDANRGLYGPAALGPEYHDHDLIDPKPTEAFLQEWLERTCGLVDKYQPVIVWFDWWIQNLAFKPYLQKFAAFYYNRAAEWGKEVAINYKYNAFPDGTAVFDVERGQVADIRQDFWQTDTSVSLNSWSYIKDHDYRSSGSLIAMLADVVAKNGALLLNIGPKADGTIPEAEQQILRDIGAWLDVNGAAIYDTAPWRVFGEGPTEVAEGAFTEATQAAFTNRDVRYTRKGDTVFGIVLGKPQGSMVFGALGDVAVKQVALLGHPGALSFAQTSEGLRVDLPDTVPGQHAWVFQIETAG